MKAMITIDDFFNLIKGKETVHLSGLGLQEIPEFIFHLKDVKDVKELHFCNNNLESLSPNIKEFRNLETLCLVSNNITSLPKELLDLENLKKIFIGGQKLIQIPEILFEIKSLCEIQIRDSPNLQSIPDKIHQLKNLRKIIISGCSLKEVPQVICELDKLESLCLCNNSLEEIPDEIRNLKNLRDFCFTNNKISEIRNSFGKLINLESLRFSDNPIRYIDVSVGRLEHLSVLIYDKNCLDDDSMFKRFGLGEITKELNKFNKRETYERVIEIPENLKTAFIQYLTFFDEYIKLIKGEEVKLNLKKHVEGIILEIETNSQIDLAKVNNYLSEYFSYLRNNLHSEEINLGMIKVNNDDITEEDFNTMIISLKSEIRNFKTKYEIAQERIRRLEESRVQTISDNEYLKSLIDRLLLKESSMKEPPQASDDSKRLVRDYIMQGKVQNAIDSLFVLVQIQCPKEINEIVLYNSRLNEISLAYRTSTISNDEFIREKQKIQGAILEFMDRYL